MNTNITTSTCSLNGIFHSSRGKLNEDSVKIFEDDTIFVAAVADGCSSSAFACIASQANCEAAINFGKATKIWDMPPKALRSTLIQHLDKAYFNTEAPYAELESTLTVLVINKISQQYICASIGDSSCLVIDNQLEKPEILTAPTNFLQKNRTIFANASGAESMMQLSIGSIENMAGFILLTDGADKLLEQESTSEVQKLLALITLDPAVCDDALEALCTEYRDTGHDDVTALVVSVNDQTAYEIASKLYPQYVAEESDTLSSDAAYDNNPEEENHSNFEEPEENTDHRSDTFFSLLQFCMEPRTATEIVEAGFCMDTELLIFLRPFLLEELISFDNTRFFTTI